LTLPAGWISNQGAAKWDGASFFSYDSPDVDEFVSPSTPLAFGVSAPWKRDLASDVRFWIAWILQNHGDTCPHEPNSRTPITIGGQPGVLLAYDCGILINLAITVRSGFGYYFTFRDPGVQAATDPTDRATFIRMLTSVRLPD
jgi:hypothetical protein